MRRKVAVVLLAVTLSGSVAAIQPTEAEAGCKAFGQNIAFLGQLLGRDFGQTAASTAPLNDTVEQEQGALCN